MNVIFTCGGTGGHINPAIAVADIWKQRHPESKILFVGGEGGMEETLVPKAGYDIVTVPTDSFDRNKSLRGVKNNARAVCTNLRAISRCKKIIRDFQPDVIVGTGGYASFPALMAGSMKKIPTCVHESNAMPGLTTRLLAGRVDRVLVCFEDCIRFYKHREKLQVVGMPVREEFLFTRREEARKELGIGEEPLIVSAFGSLGAKAMNEAMADLFALEQAAGYPYTHIHATGSLGWEWMPELVAQKGVSLEGNPHIRMQEYIYNMPTMMAAADVFISRAGAGSCNEIAACGTPCILIPSPNVTDNHQEKNARVLSDRGGAVLMLEKDCTAGKLMQTVQQLLSDREGYSQMKRQLLSMAVPDSAQRMCNIMEQLAMGKE